MAKIVLLQEGQAVPFELTAAETVIGRHPECTFQINSNMVSRKHAKIVKKGDQFIVEDLQSGNGTFVNGKKIEGPAGLVHDDVGWSAQAVVRSALGPEVLAQQIGPSLAAAGWHLVTQGGQGPCAWSCWERGDRAFGLQVRGTPDPPADALRVAASIPAMS